MGYPMTYKRLINRNGLVGGGYDKPVPPRWLHTAPKVAGGLSEAERSRLLDSLIRHAEETAEAWNRKLANVLGDLRRLEDDTLDERAICEQIARQLELDADTVAAVLSAWMDIP